VKPAEHKTVQARILAYAEAIGWRIVSREEAGIGADSIQMSRPPTLPNIVRTSSTNCSRCGNSIRATQGRGTPPIIAPLKHVKVAQYLNLATK
jgi:hypothetical protein